MGRLKSEEVGFDEGTRKLTLAALDQAKSLSTSVVLLSSVR